MPNTSFLDAANQILPDLIGLRRAIHAEPELGLHTPKTVAKVRAALSELPLEYCEGPGSTGFVATLRGAAPGPSVLLRGDMDALPMPEHTELPYASKIAGVMHACGHDAHTAMLVGAARLLCARRDQLAGSVMFMFQPGEEGYHGARIMLEDGLIDPLPSAAFALHVKPNSPHGVFSGRAGPLLASADQFKIEIVGQGGHASMPHEALDPIPIACELVLALQSFVTRRFSVFDPVVVTVARIDAGTTYNVIPDAATILGTVRTLSPEARAAAQEGVRRLALAIAEAHGGKALISFEEGFPVTWCDARAVRLAKRAIEAELGADAWSHADNPVMGAEDFSYVLEKVPGAMLLLGAASEGDDWASCCGLHSSRMTIDEAVLARGAAALSAIALAYLEEGLT